MKIFVSQGRPYTAKQKVFVDALEAFLERNGCIPHTVGRTVHTAIQPVQRVRKEMKGCDGAVILAFTRYHIPETIEFPGTDKPEQLKNLRHPTVWNQLEGAMAYGLDLPLLILVENNLTRQGMLSDRTEWFPQLVDLDPSLFDSNEFKGIFADWKLFAEKHKANRQERNTNDVLEVAGSSPAKESVAKLLGRMTAGQIWKALGALATVGGAIFALGYWIGQHFGKMP
jgi:hypothetical protein